LGSSGRRILTEFQASLGYIVKSYLKKKQSTTKSLKHTSDAALSQSHRIN
jgi:hypothetical protein